MILVNEGDVTYKNGNRYVAIEATIKMHCSDMAHGEFKAFLEALKEEPELFLIFLEEFNNISKQIQEELLKNGKNNSSD